MTNPNEVADRFGRAFRDAEFALKRSGYQRNKHIAETDWDGVARDLGPDFFADIVDRGIAKTLIGEPPRRLMQDLQWAPEAPVPFTTAQELIVQGVCRVRSSYFHGEKFRGGTEGQWARDMTLLQEAHAVLEAALAWLVRARP